MKELWRKKSVKAVFAVVVILAAVVIVSISAQSFERKRNYNGHIDSAEKYLAELNYEQAIVEYTLALEIEPNAEKVLDALEQTYLDYAQSLADAGDYEKAVSVLEDGYAMTGRESMQTKKEELLLCLKRNRYLIDDLLWNELRVSDYYGLEQYISDAQIKEMCVPWINYYEQYTFNELDDLQRWELSDLYYLVGEFEKCKEINKINNKFNFNDTSYGMYVGMGDEDEFKESGELGNGEVYKIYVYGEDSYTRIMEFGETGKIIKSTSGWEYEGDKVTWECVYEYDAEGRLSKTTESEYHSKEDIEQIKVYTYVYNEKGFTKHYSYEDSRGHIVRYSTDYEINEYGGVVEWGETYDVYEF